MPTCWGWRGKDTARNESCRGAERTVRPQGPRRAGLGDTLRKHRKAGRENPRQSSTAKVCWAGEGAEERKTEGAGGQQELEEDAGMQKPRGQDG